MEDSNKQVTIHDVSKVAGVSVSTVSRVINQSAGVKEELAERVNKAIKELGYKPNYSARFLKTRKSYSVFYIIPEINNPYFTSIYEGLRMRMEEGGYMAFLYEAHDPSAVFKLLIDRGVDGVAIDPLYSDEAEKILKPKGIPYVFCSSPVTLGLPNSININLYAIVLRLFEEIFKRGHERVGYIAFKDMKAYEFDRLHAFEKAAKNYGKAYSVNQVSFQEVHKSKFSCGYSGLNELLDKFPDMSAIAASNDLIAMGAMAAAKDRGLRVPEDISITGFDNLDHSRYTTPALTTVNLPKMKQGELAAEMLIKLIEDPNSVSYSVNLDAEIVYRDSLIDFPEN